jgi:hypothetical protein
MIKKQELGKICTAKSVKIFVLHRVSLVRRMFWTGNAIQLTEMRKGREETREQEGGDC